MKLTSSATKISFLNEQDGEYEDEQNSEEDIFRGADDMDESNELESEIEASNKLNIGHEHYQTVHPPPPTQNNVSPTPPTQNIAPYSPTHPHLPKMMSHLPNIIHTHSK